MATTFDSSFKSEAHYGGRLRKTIQGKYVAERSTDGKLRRQTFSTRKAAVDHLKSLGAQRDKHGKIVSALTGGQLRDAKDALHRLKEAGHDITLCAAIDDYIERHPISDHVHTLQEVIDMHLDSMRRRKCRPDSITGTRKILSMLATHIGADRAYTDITQEEISDMVKGWDVALRTKKNRIREMRTLFLFAEKRNLRNPVPDGIEIEDEKQDEKPAVIMKPEDVGRFMEWVEESKPKRHVVSYAIQFFAGIRPRGEITRLTWADIRLDEKNSIGGKGVIRLEGNRTKTRGIRSIPITPNLREWLLRYAGKGKVSPAYSGLSKTRQEACKALGVKWAPDITRHSFATAAGEIYGQADAAQWLGHEQSMRMFKKHYEGQMTYEEATRFFEIEPTSGKSGKVIRMEAAS